MSRIRTIKPEFFKHFDLYKAEIEENLPLRLGYAGLWTACDREGRFKWRPEELKLDCLPFDVIDFSRVLDALETRGFIVKYKHENKIYGFIPSWKDHQHINNRESESILPNPYESEILTREPRVNDVTETCTRGKEGERKGKEGVNDASLTQQIPVPISDLPEVKIPKGTEKSKSKKNEDVPLNEIPFKTEEAKKAWANLIASQKWRKKTNNALNIAMRQLSNFNAEKEEFIVLQIERAIMSEWQGVVFPDTEEQYQKWLKSKQHPQNGIQQPNQIPPTQQPASSIYKKFPKVPQTP